VDNVNYITNSYLDIAPPEQKIYKNPANGFIFPEATGTARTAKTRKI
jgi:hypothetical protein